MADIFLSYAEEDRPTADKIAGLLEANGWTVWWDRRIPAGKTWRAVIEEALHGMRCMVVLWSKSSVESEWVKEEAEEGRVRGKLVPILIERVVPPLGLRGLQAADLADWDGTSHTTGVRQLIDDLQAMLGIPPIPPGVPPETAAEGETRAAEEVSILRRKLITAATPDAIQQLLYEVEALLARHPLNIEGRSLRDDIRRALAPPPRGAASPARPSGSRFPRPAAVWLSVALVAPLLMLLFVQERRGDVPVSVPERGGPAAQPDMTGTAEPAKPRVVVPASPEQEVEKTPITPAVEKPADAAKGGQMASQVCAACHGAGGNSSNPVFPSLAGKSAGYIVTQLGNYKIGVRKNAVMSGFAAPLSSEDMRDLGTYYQQQKPKLVAAIKPAANKQKPARCAAILERATLGQALSDDDRAFLKKEC